MYNKWSKKRLVLTQYKLRWCEVVSFPLTCHIHHINRVCVFEGNMVSQKVVENHELLR